MWLALRLEQTTGGVLEDLRGVMVMFVGRTLAACFQNRYLSTFTYLTIGGLLIHSNVLVYHEV